MIPCHVSLEGIAEKKNGEQRQVPWLVFPLMFRLLGLNSPLGYNHCFWIVPHSFISLPSFYDSSFVLIFQVVFFPQYKSIVCSIIC